MTKLKILITGSSGYVGYVLSKFFSDKGIDVVGLDISTNPVWPGNNHFRFYKCDITDKKLLEEILKKEKPTTIIHLAYLMSPIHDVAREHDIDVNGSKYIFQAADKSESVKQFIQFSSTSTYGGWPDNELWIKEIQQLRPRDYRYGINKKKVEEYYLDFNKRADLKLVILRMCTAIGPMYHKPGGVVSFLSNARFLAKVNGRYCEVQFIHEDDLTELIELIINDSEIQGIYNLAPDSYATTKELSNGKFSLYLPLRPVRGIISVLWALRIVSMRAAVITLTAYGIVVDPKKLMDRYNYKFKHSTKSGFEDTVKKRKELGTL